jgi:phosphatidylserine/phosphatidylglycerophosphate/cardiolipin synthase-like enzyme
VSTSATGRLVDEDNHPWENLTVSARSRSGLFDTDLAHQTSDADGRFTLNYSPDNPPALGFGPRGIAFTVTDKVLRVVARLERDDVADPVLAVGDVVIKRADATGFLVTLGTGTPAFLSSGNAVKLLIDNVDAWGHVSRLFLDATSEIQLMQLDFDVPPKFSPFPLAEKPMLVFHFGEPDLSAAALRELSVRDDRPERILASQAHDHQVDIRVLLNRFVVEPHIIGLGGVFLGVGALLVLFVGGLLEGYGLKTSLDEVSKYFGQVGEPRIKVHGAPTSPLGPTHAKLVIVDGVEAVDVASPWTQNYFGDPSHAIDDPRRGNHSGPSGGGGHPIHDVSIAVRGPAVADLHEAFRLHWNTAVPEDPVPSITPPPAQTSGLDAIASVQVVRTLTSGRFADPAHGEKGVLEAYLRAIASAQQFIYFENQYFTDDTIGSALIEALKDRSRPDLQVILLINIDPDQPLYPGWQRQLITRIRKALPEDAARKRFAVFTRWTHEVSPPARPRIVPNYVHAKVGIVDDQWATVGSANLDGSSLDFTQFLHAFQFGDVRNSEVNLVILNGVDGQPQTEAVGLLRRRLWAEHLGFESPPGVLNPNDPALAAPPTGKGWAEVWTETALTKLNSLKTNPTVPVLADILPWPDVDKTFDTPRKHLEALLGQTIIDFDPIKNTRLFDFETGKWLSDARVDG